MDLLHRAENKVSDIVFMARREVMRQKIKAEQSAINAVKAL